MKNHFSVFLGGNWFGNFFQFSGFSKLTRNPLMAFIYVIISKWYITVTIAAIVVTFWVFKGLKDSGAIDTAEKVVFDALNETKAVAQHCVPKIMDFTAFWYCLEHTPKYKPTDAEKRLEEQLSGQLIDKETEAAANQDPYATTDLAQ